MEKENALFLILYLFLCLGLSCISNGPIRYKIFGYKKYAAIELTGKAPSASKFVAVPVGMAADTLVTGLDIPINFIWAVRLVFTHAMGDDTAPRNALNIGILTFLWWYPFTIAAIYVWPRHMYEKFLGKETGIFRDAV